VLFPYHFLRVKHKTRRDEPCVESGTSSLVLCDSSHFLKILQSPPYGFLSVDERYILCIYTRYTRRNNDT
jgi:hypothetical protein